MSEQVAWPEEQVRAPGEPQGATPSLSLWSVRGPLPDRAAVEAAIDALCESASAGADADVVRALQAALPGYRASGAHDRSRPPQRTPLRLDDGSGEPSVIVSEGVGAGGSR
jgi:hypothetical protein